MKKILRSLLYTKAEEKLAAKENLGRTKTERFLSLTTAETNEALPHLRHAARSAQPPPRQGPAKGHGGARPRSFRRAGGGRRGRGPGGRGSREIRGSSPCNCLCTSAHDAEPKPGAGSLAKRQRCRTAAAGCTAENHRGLRTVTRTRSSMGATPPKRSPAGERSPRCCGV
jgi:hypothetical protein